MSNLDFSPFGFADDLEPGQKVKATDLDFYALLRRQSGAGKLYFNQRRAVLLDVEAMGALRQQLIDTVGAEVARGILVRFGRDHGERDAEALQEAFEWESEADWLTAGPLLHGLEGIVQTNVEQVEFDRESDRFLMQGTWHHSYEAEEHLSRLGQSEEPVCWTLTGYASGYASRFFGRKVVAVETQCAGQGHDHSCWEIRPAEAWNGEAGSVLQALEQVDLSGELTATDEQSQTKSPQQLAELEDTATFLDSIVENIPSMVFVKNAEDLKFVRFNKAGETLIGISREEMLGKNDYDFFPKEEADFFVAKDREVLESGQLLDIPEEEIDTAHQGTRILHTRKVPIMGSEGQPKYLLGISEDITERKRTQAELRRLSLAVEQSANTIVITDTDGYIEYVNPKFVETTGYTEAEAVGEHTRILKSGETSQAEYQEMWQTIATGGQWQGEFHNKRKDGSLFWEWATISPIENADGKITHYLAVKEEITQRKEVQHALEQERTLLRSLIDSIPDLIYYKDRAGAYLGCNAAFENFVGRTEQQLAGKTDRALFSPQVAERFIENDQIVLRWGKARRSEEWIERDNGPILLETLKTPLYAPNGQIRGLIGLSRDITARRKSEEDLKARATQLETVAQVSAATSNILDVGKLLQTVVDLTKTNFDLYHAHIYLLDEGGTALKLAAGAGSVGRKMVRQGWKIPMRRERSLVVQAARTRRGVIANDVQQNPDYFQNPLLSETCSELAVPLIAREKLLGVLDVQADTINRFTPDDIQIKTTLAAQIAVALDNARLFQETQTALAEVEATQRRYTVQAWDAYQGRLAARSYQYVRDGSPLAAEGLPSATDQALVTKEMAVVTTSTEQTAENTAESADAKQPVQPPSGLMIPLTVRNEIIGVLGLQETGSGRTWTAEEQAIIEAVARQMALAAENLRLLDETQQQAAREQLARQITDKLRASQDIETALKTATTELSKALRASRAVADLQVSETDA